MAPIPPFSTLDHDNPPQAGEVLHALSIDLLNGGKKDGAITALAKQLYQEAWENKHSKVSGWCRGNFIQKRGQLYLPDFERIVEVFWQKPGGFQNGHDVLAFARCIGRIKQGKGEGVPILELADMLDKEWLARLGLTLEEINRAGNIPLRDYRYPRSRFNIRRNEIEQKIIDIARRAQVSKRPIAIYGQPGVGKTKLIERLEGNDWGNQFELKKVFYLNGQGIYHHLLDWYQEQMSVRPVRGIRLDDLIVELKIKLAGKKIIIFMDDVVSAESVNRVSEILDKKQNCLLIVTTHSQSAVREISTLPELVLTLDGFSFDETKELFEIVQKTKLVNHQLDDFRALHTLLKGNPLGLHFAFSRFEDVGLSDLVQLLASSDFDIPTGMLREIFLPLEVGYERLPGYLKRTFALLGAAGEFLFDDEETLSFILCPQNERVSIPKTKLLIRDIQTAMSPFILGADNKALTMHKQTHLFAFSKFRQLSIEDQQFANQWQDRMYSARYGELKIISFAEAWRLRTSKDFSERRPLKRNPIQKLLETLEMLILIRNSDWEMAQQHKEFFTVREYLQIRFIAEKENRNYKTIRLVFFVFLFSYFGVVNNVWLRYAGIIALGIGTLLVPIMFWAWLENYKFVIHWALVWKEIIKRKEKK